MSEPQKSNPSAFNSFVAAIDEGRVHHDLSEKLRDLIGDMSNHKAEFGGAVNGEISVKFSLKLDGGYVEVTSKVEVKSPKKPSAKSIMWVTPENNLVGQNPKQQNLFRDVTAPASDAVNA